MSNIIEVQNLSKKYGSFLAVDNISFEGQEGEVLGFLGPNGAGKTTTMRMLTCYMPATSGTAYIDGYDIFEDSFKVRERIGYLPEIPPLYSDMTVKSFLKFVAEIKQMDSRGINSRVEEVLSDCGLVQMQTRLISKLSRGYKQRVGIAQAIIHNPKVIILDEPTVGLDPQQVIEIRELIKDLAVDKSVLLSTHILSEAEMLCKHVVIINKGTIVAKGSWQDMQDKLQEMLVVKLVMPVLDQSRMDIIQSMEFVKELRKTDETTLLVYCDKNSDARVRLMKLVTDNNWDIEEIKTEKMSLEEIFIRFTGNIKVAEGENV